MAEDIDPPGEAQSTKRHATIYCKGADTPLRPGESPTSNAAVRQPGSTTPAVHGEQVESGPPLEPDSLHKQGPPDVEAWYALLKWREKRREQEDEQRQKRQAVEGAQLYRRIEEHRQAVAQHNRRNWHNRIGEKRARQVAAQDNKTGPTPEEQYRLFCEDVTKQWERHQRTIARNLAYACA